MADFLEGDAGSTLAHDMSIQLDRMESSIAKQGYADGFVAGKEKGS